MAYPRVHEIAAELGVESALVMAKLRELGEFVRGPSSTVPPPVARRLREAFGRPQSSAPIEAKSAPPARIPSPVAPESFDPTSPSSREFGWQANPVKAPSHPQLMTELNRAERRFPVIREHRNSLSRLGSQIVYMSTPRDAADCQVALVRFSGAIESAFGFTRQLMIFYSPYRDMQVRTYEAAMRELAKLDRNVTPDVFFMWSPDPRLATKLNDWSSPGRLAIPLTLEDADSVGLITLLREHLHVRDLFYETTPVHGSKFYGRRTILQTLREDVLAQRVSGIFGLRKAGKTSILMQLRQELESERVVSVLVDLETFPSPPEDPTDDIVADIRRRVLDELRASKLRTKELAELGERPSILEFKNAFQAILRRLEAAGVRVLLMLDEIEYLTPADRIDIAEGPMPRIAQLLASLRSLVQETGNFTFLMSGLTSAIVESGRLYGRPNPLFSWAKGTYIGPLDRGEADGLATSVSARMGIRIEPGALEALYDASGGHAYLYRNLASSVVSTLPMDVMDRTMSRSAVLKRLAYWSSSVRGNVDEMVRHVERYYATEAFLLELLRDNPNDFHELAPDEPEATRHLLELGLIQQSGEGYEVNVLLELR